jgi:DHA1 family inner membrane transport protein
MDTALPPLPDTPVLPPAEASIALVLFSLAMGGFAIGTTEFATMSLLPYFAPALAISEATASHVISAYALGVVIGAPLLAVLGARQSRRRMLVWLMAAFALFNGLSALAPTYPIMLLMRFLSGLPHGAYFGVAALVSASMVPKHKRAQAVARTMLGLTIATIIGVPLANVIGQFFGWRLGFALVAFIALLTAILVWKFVPRDAPDSHAHPLRELRGLRNRHIWLTLSISAIGFGGLFAVYTYVASTLITVTGSGEKSVPLVLALIGVGLTAGTLIGSTLADRIGMRAAKYVLLWSAASLFLYPFATGNYIAMCVVGVLVGMVGGLGTILQTRLMDVAADAQMVAAALNHSAFNTANALGPWLAGIAITLGWGFPSTGFVGCAMALGGLGLWALAMRADRQSPVISAA